MLERTKGHARLSCSKDQRFSVETVAFILEMLNTKYDSNSQLIEVEMRDKRILSDSNKPVTQYLSLLQKKGFIRYYKEQAIYIPTDRGIHFLKIYSMLASLLI